MGPHAPPRPDGRHATLCEALHRRRRGARPMLGRLPWVGASEGAAALPEWRASEGAAVQGGCHRQLGRRHRHGGGEGRCRGQHRGRGQAGRLGGRQRRPLAGAQLGLDAKLREGKSKAGAEVVRPGCRQMGGSWSMPLEEKAISPPCWICRRAANITAHRTSPKEPLCPAAAAAPAAATATQQQQAGSSSQHPPACRARP